MYSGAVAEKISGRWQEEFRNDAGGGGLRLTVTRKGVEVFGWYDGFGGLEGIYLSWAEFDQARERVSRGKPA